MKTSMKMDELAHYKKVQKASLLMMTRMHSALDEIAAQEAADVEAKAMRSIAKGALEDIKILAADCKPQ